MAIQKEDLRMAARCLRPESWMVGEQLQSSFGILSLEVIESDWTNGKPDGAGELSILSPLLYLMNPIGSNRRALNKYRVLHRIAVRSGRVDGNLEHGTNHESATFILQEWEKEPRASEPFGI
jgi:hypothetical protein